MTKRILEILDNVRYWDTCPEEYKKDIETFLEEHNPALRIHDVVFMTQDGRQLLMSERAEIEERPVWD